MSKKIGFGAIILAIAILLVLSTNIIRSCTQRKKVELEEQISFLKEEFVPMAFEISKYSDNEIKLKTVFYDLDGKKVGSQNIKLTGNELNFDFQVIKLNGKSYIFFPVGIYSDLLAINDAVKVTDCYNRNGFPKIYDGLTEIKDEKGKSLDYTSKNDINDKLILYFDWTINGMKDFDTESHGVAVHDIKNVAQFKKGFVYNVVCHPHTGAIEIIRK